MSTRTVSAVTSLFALGLLLLGALFIFAPSESTALLLGRAALPDLVFSLLGSALFGLGQMNWLTRHSPLGGIYGRPVLLANLVHFVVGGLALLRGAFAAPGTGWLWGLCAFYLAGAAFYGPLLFVTPKPKSQPVTG